MIIYLVWTTYEDVEAAFFKKEDAEKWCVNYLKENPKYGYRDRTQDDFNITWIRVQ